MSDLTCSAKVAKMLLFICTLFVALAGLALFGCGIWFVTAPKSVNLLNVIHDDSFQQLIRASGGILIGVGLVLMVVGIAGCWGSIAQKTSCLTCYQALLVLFIILQIIATVLSGVFHTQINDGLASSMYKVVNESDGYGNNTVITEAWNFMQNELECCGVKSYSDWRTSWWKIHTTDGSINEIPATCCKLNNTDLMHPEVRDMTACNEEARSNTPIKELNSKGCDTKFEDWFRSYWAVLIGIVIGVIVIEVAGIVLSCCIVSSIKRGYEYV